MKVLLDEMMSKHWAEVLPGHSVVHVHELRWAQIKNGELLRRCDEEGIGALLTKDWQMGHQQSLRTRTVSIVVLRLLSQAVSDQLAMAPLVMVALSSLEPGTVVEVKDPA